MNRGKRNISEEEFKRRFLDLINLSHEELKLKYGKGIFKTDKEIGKIFGGFHKIVTSKPKEFCFHPEQNNCSPSLIKAHSLPKSLLKILMDSTHHLLIFNSEFLMLQPPLSKISRIGINKATTFLGLCSNHDSMTFLPLDNKPVNNYDSEYQFLLCYRAFLKEYFVKTNQYDLSKTLVGHVKKDDQEGLAFSFSCIYAYGCYVGWHYLTIVKKALDESLVKKNFTSYFEYGVREIDKFLPIAVCSLFTPATDRNNNQLNNFKDSKEMPKYVFLSIIPSQNKTYVFYAVLKKQGKELKTFIEPFSTLKQEDFLDYLSEIILRNIENFIVSPQYWEKIPKDKRKEIEKFFYETTFNKKIEYSSIKHNIFVP